MNLLTRDRPLRVLLAYRSDVDVHGGAGAVMDGTARGLRAHGVEVDITHDLEPALDKAYDLVHVFNVWSPETALQQMHYVHQQGVPLVWQPIYLKLSEYAWATRAVRALFAPERDEDERQQLLRAYARGELKINGIGRWGPNEAHPDLFRYVREMAELADFICACSRHEIQGLFQAAGLTSTPFRVIRHGVDSTTFAAASPDAFRAQLGFEADFVLCVGAVEARKNQLFLVEALRGTGVKLVLVGPCFEPDYLALVRERGGSDVVYFDRLPRALVASAYKAARVHALPSYAEGSALASMEAAAAGCALVVSDRSSEFEYYDDFPFYCDPADPNAIRVALQAAWVSRTAEPDRWQALAHHMRAHTWERAGLETLEVYRRTLATVADKRRLAARASAATAEARAFAGLVFYDELLSSPDLLRSWATTFAADEQATLVVYAPAASPDELEARLSAALKSALPDGGDRVDLIALAPPAPADELVAPGVDAVLSGRPAAGLFANLPHANPLDRNTLRALAEHRWAAASRWSHSTSGHSPRIGNVNRLAA